MKEKRISVNKIEVNYKIAGNGPAILVLHGWGGSSDSWLKVQNILSKQGYTVLVPDLPGFGKTSPPKDSWTVGDYMKFLSSFLNEIKKKEKFSEPFYLLGHSFGGRISIKFSLDYPKSVKKLILLDSAGIRQPKDFKGLAIFFIANLGNALFTSKRMARMKDSFRNMFYKLIRNRDYVKAEGIMKETIRKVLNEDLFSLLSKLDQKTLIIWGDKDKMVPIKYAYVFKDNIKNSKLVVFKNIGHSPHLECPLELSGQIKNFFN